MIFKENSNVNKFEAFEPHFTEEQLDENATFKNGLVKLENDHSPPERVGELAGINNEPKKESLGSLLIEQE